MLESRVGALASGIGGVEEETGATTGSGELAAMQLAVDEPAAVVRRALWRVRGSEGVRVTRHRRVCAVVLRVAARSRNGTGGTRDEAGGAVVRNVESADGAGGGRGKVGVLPLEVLQVGVAPRELAATARNLTSIGALSGAANACQCLRNGSGWLDSLDPAVTSKRRRVGESLVAGFTVMGALASAES